jgi:peptidoglycan/xylan/chitin deacetylase (PgdA/CDA1 family)
MPSFRFDRFATLYLVFPALRLVPFLRPQGLSILMYHHISDEPEPGFSEYFRLNTSPTVFKEHMEFLHSNGYKVVGLLEGLRLLQTNAVTAKHVVITFDDGFQSIYTNAFPVLRVRQWPATVFLPTRYINDKRATFRSIPCLSWSEIKEMQDKNIEFGSHTHTHPKLEHCSWLDVENELAISKNIIENKLGKRVATFAYPYAFPEINASFISQLDAKLKRLDYECCVTTRIGRSRRMDSRFQLKRIPLNDCDDPKLLNAKLNAAYDWLSFPQKLLKSSRVRQAECHKSN